jgi:hypothetical protein
MFRTAPLFIIRSFSLHTQQYIQIMLTACSQAVSIACMTYTTAVYSEKLLMMDRGTVRNM